MKYVICRTLCVKWSCHRVKIWKYISLHVYIPACLCIYFSIYMLKSVFVLNTHTFPGSWLALSLHSVLFWWTASHMASVKPTRFFMLCVLMGDTGTRVGSIFSFTYGPNVCFLSVRIHFEWLGSLLNPLLTIWGITPGLEVVVIEPSFGSSLKIPACLPITAIH